MNNIEDKYQELGGKNGPLGPATGKEKAFPGGRIRCYKEGVICWTPATGAVHFRDALARRWLEIGGTSSAIGLPESDQKETGGVSRVRFKYGIMRSRFFDCQILFLQQNMALLPKIPLPKSIYQPYRGKERKLALKSLKAFIHKRKPDVVGLSEVFDNDEKRDFATTFLDAHGIGDPKKYKPRLYCSTGPDEADIEEDGGLLLLSRHPCVSSHSTIFRDAKGSDRFSNKGALHMRIRVPGCRTYCDIFHAHLQNPNEGGNEASRTIVDKQLRHLNTFIQANSDTYRPAILMGDLNTDGRKRRLHTGLIHFLGNPDDQWITIGDGSPGVTSDRYGSFTGSRRDKNDNMRNREGTRLDYFLSFNDKKYYPVYRDIDLLILQSSKGRDTSDHYGLTIRQVGLQGVNSVISRRIRRVKVSLIGFTCLEETNEVGSDEVYFYLKLKEKGSSDRWRSVKTEVKKGVKTGNTRSFGRPKALACKDPGKSLRVRVSGIEEDDWPNADDVIGHSQIVIKRSELLELVGRSKDITMPILKGDGGEYAVQVRVEVT